ncbi:hypothetical protein [Marinovum sp.]|uniref:hypothetical protein n=1 Tax=Marinovum sp. TaxID=2024839 RepID=UPI002B26C9AD|nr:hypothetical protein [Marinovum sp.]
MALYTNQQAEGQGLDMSGSGQFPFSFQGQWQVNGRQIVVQGSKSGGVGFAPTSFFFQSAFISEGEMAFTHHYDNGQVYASRCLRIG